MYKNIFKPLSFILFFIIAIQSQSQYFTDVTISANITSPAGMGFNVVWIDYNNDGFLDFFGSADETFFYRNSGDGTFTNVTQTTGLAGIIPNSMAVADYDKDGYKDLLIASNMYGIPVVIYQNINGEYFQAADSLDDYAETALWIDYNGDGYLDVFSSCSSGVELYQNIGDNTFHDVTASMGLTDIAGVTASAADFNNDGFSDIYVGAYSRNTLLKNIAGTFYEDVTNSAGVADFRKTVAVAWGDYNNDGNMDLYSANIQSNRNVFFKNNGNETFTDLTQVAGIPDLGDARTCTWIDYNNDGWMDLFNTNHINPNKLYLNNEDGTFTDVASASGITDPEDGFGISWGDYDRDGDLDVIICGHTGLTLNLLRNDGGNSKNYLFLNIKGVFDNASGIGTRIKLYAGGECQTQDLCGATGNHGQNALPVHFGLDTVTMVDSIILIWPSGMIQKLYNIAANQYIDIIQDGNVPPCIFHLLCPTQDTIIPNKIVNFIWSSSEDPDNNNPIEYYLALNSSNNDTLISGIADTTISVDISNWAIADSSVQWHVIATDGECFRNSWENWEFIYSPTTAIDDIYKKAEETVLYSNYPNPFSYETTISFYIAEDVKNAEIIIYNIKRQKIKSFDVTQSPSASLRTGGAEGSIVWNGTDDSGNPVGSGVYFYQLITRNNFSETKRMLLLK